MRIRSRLARLVIFGCLAVPLSGCLEKKYYPTIEIDEGSFISPLGTFDVRSYKDADTKDSRYSLYRQDEAPEIHAYGNDKVTFFTMGLLAQYEGIGIVTFGDEIKRLAIKKYTYTLNNLEKKFDLQLSKGDFNRDRKADSKRIKYRILVTLPEPLAAIDTRSSGGGLGSSSVKLIRAGATDVHRFIIDFSLNDEPYKIDFKFKVKLATRWTFGVPGMP